MDMKIRPATVDDAHALARIYNHYVLETVVTFETTPVTRTDMTQRIIETAAIPLPWLVAETADGVIGFAYASKWKGRCAYRFAVETTIYLDHRNTGRGAGRRLYSELIAEIKLLPMRAVIGGISLPNEASIALHEKLGFRKVGHFEQVGFKLDRWVDVGYWELLL